jgi:hypothetical protein
MRIFTGNSFQALKCAKYFGASRNLPGMQFPLLNSDLVRFVLREMLAHDVMCWQGRSHLSGRALARCS